MRFFIFPLDSIYIAVAADNVKRFISSDAELSETDHINMPVYMIFRKLNGIENISCHGIVLKQETNDNKTIVIIIPPVERDIDVEEKQIQSLPGSLKGIYSSFSGICFNEQKIIFFLDIEKFSSLWLSKFKDELPVLFPSKGQVSG